MASTAIKLWLRLATSRSGVACPEIPPLIYSWDIVLDCMDRVEDPEVR